MEELHDKRFPGESAQYRKERNRLLLTEKDLRRQVEEVAALRRQLPTGGLLKEDYIFDEGADDLSDERIVQQVKFSQLFSKENASLVLYSFMYGPDALAPCPSCTSILDGLNGSAPHVLDRINFVVVARSPIGRLREVARDRGWSNLGLLSSHDNTYNADYFAENESGDQIPALNVFRKSGGEFHHAYNTELLYASSEEGQHMRHVDFLWPLWNMSDLTAEGRGTEWGPKLLYDSEQLLSIT